MGPGLRRDDLSELMRNFKTALTQSRRHPPAAGPSGPAEAAIFFRNRDIVDAGFAAAHQAVLVELPLLVAVGAMPLPGIVMPLVLKPHRDAIAVERPEILDQAILLFLLPFAGEERDDRGAALKNSERLRQRLSSV